MTATGISRFHGWSDSPQGPDREPIRAWVLIAVLALACVLSQFVVLKLSF